MSEVISSSESNSYYEDSMQAIGDEKDKGKITQLQQEELSPINYKTQALLTLFFGSLGINDFYAGNHLQGVAKMGVTMILGPHLGFQLQQQIGALISLVSLAQLNSGQYVDSDGKAIRQVVQLKKEDLSSTDQATALVLATFLGFLGAHQFYAGKPFKGALMICTIGGLGIWALVNVYQNCDLQFQRW